MQWRIAVSWLSGYLFTSLFTPVIFYYHGAVMAGQLGMTWSMAMALQLIASMWLTTRAPEFGVLIKRKKYRDLDRLLFHAAAVAVGIAAAGSAVILAFVWALYSYRSPLAVRLLPPLPTLFFLAATILMQVSIAQSTYLRAHKQEPFMLMSLLSGVSSALLVFITGSRWGAQGIAVSYFSIIALFGIPCGTVIWYRCRNLWHSDYVAGPEPAPGSGL
jgi:O-antigen/teichoic acid export membrane protein